jgi:rubrerythrin
MEKKIIFKTFKDWICQCGTYIIFAEDCPKCGKPKPKYNK